MIKGSEATHHFGEKVEVRGVVFDMYTSPKETHSSTWSGGTPLVIHWISFHGYRAFSRQSVPEVVRRQGIGMIGMIRLYKGKSEIKAVAKARPRLRIEPLFF